MARRPSQTRKVRRGLMLYVALGEAVLYWRSTLSAKQRSDADRAEGWIRGVYAANEEQDRASRRAAADRGRARKQQP